MIQKLQLKSFGKFRDQRFALGRLTLFCGPNEAGKSTVFDALFDALCRPKATTVPGRRLQDRYGRDRQADLVWDGTPFAMSETDFLDVCSISALREPPRFGSGGSWMSTIKSRLFAGGINPDLVRERLEKLGDTRGSLRHMKELKELRQREQELRDELSRLERVREESLQGLQQARAAGERIGVLEETVAGLQRERAQAEDTVRQHELIRERAGLREALAAAVRRQEFGQRLQGLQLPDAAERERLTGLQQQVTRLEQQLAVLQGSLDERQQERERLQTALREQETAAVSAGARAAEAERLLIRLRDAGVGAHDTPGMAGNAHYETGGSLANPGATGTNPGSEADAAVAAGGAEKRAMDWRRWAATLGLGLAAGIGLALMVFGILAAGSPGLPLPGWLPDWLAGGLLASGWLAAVIGGTTAAAAFGLGLGLLLRARRAAGNRQRREAVLQELRRAAELSLQLDAAALTGEALVQALRRCSQEPERLRQQSALEQQRLTELEERLEAGTRQQQRDTAELDAARSALQQLLQGYRCESVQDLSRREAERHQLEERIAEEDRRLAESMRQLDLHDPQLLHSELSRRVNQLDEQILLDTPSEAGIRAARQRLQELQAQLRQSEEELARCRVDHQGYRTAYDSRFGSLPQEFLQVERELDRVRAQQQEIELNRQAAETAAEIVAELQADASEQLVQLGRQVAAWFGDIVQIDRGIRFTAFDDAGVAVEDAGGTSRPLEQLSSGTRDAFYLAARLALIAESHLEPGLVVLDDPCVTMDPERTRQAMQLLARFLADTDHQVVFLSKDPETAGYVRAALPKQLLNNGYREHQLQR
ncbi:ATP-binding protein [Spirochaeta africana]|uniref:Rad50/SbcC-type AAA domain-containing protein n=1 Tax=Spirochaeta africana (strain ATCC 700263 / DSM 8902 / Z-7692) TaxID=889378 RepID=H9UI26_SPIAZ|nr:AAA family ATPase [Spirochaeta africana]AFG37169.1 hypothetical protein Spiaf_1082 [Spirochaeta africana DSM 8902]